MKITDTDQAARFIRTADRKATVEWNYEGKAFMALKTTRGWYVAKKGSSESWPAMQAQALINSINGAEIIATP